MISANGIFPAASEARNAGQTYLIVHQEVRDIEAAILFAIQNGLYTAYIINTLMTNTEISSFANITNVNTSTGVITLPNHGFLDGQEIQFSSTGTLPSPLLASTTYFAMVQDVNTFKVSSSYINELTNVNITLTNQGSGTHKARKIIPAQQFFNTWRGTRSDRGMSTQMGEVIQYFGRLGYDITRQTNPATSCTFNWLVRW